MLFKADNLFLFVEGIQFRDGKYETTDENEIEILKRYSDSISVLEEKEYEAENKTVEESTVETEVLEEKASKKSKKSEE